MSDDTSASQQYNDRLYPPTNFNVSSPVFRPLSSFLELDPQVQSQIEQLMGATRFRSAIERVFTILDDHPTHPAALTLAIRILSASRSTELQAEEPLTLTHLRDRRLDPIFTVCSHCRVSTWVSPNSFTELLLASVTFDPAGVQCYSCGYVICKNCLEQLFPGDSTVKKCPHCGENALRTPVYPTGRLPEQMQRRKVRVAQVQVYCQGPLQPLDDYLIKQLEIFSPDALEDKAEILGFAVSPWPNFIGEFVRGHLAENSNTYLNGNENPQEYDTLHVKDTAGEPIYLVKYWMNPTRKPSSPSFVTRLFSGVSGGSHSIRKFSLLPLYGKYRNIFVFGKVQNKTPHYERAKKQVVERVLASHRSNIPEGARIRTFLNPSLPSPTATTGGLEGFVRVFQLKMGMELDDYQTEFVRQNNYDFLVIYMR